MGAILGWEYAINYATKNKYLRRSLFDVVGLLRGDRLCGESVDILGDRFVMRLRGDLIK
jgi:hypothetical protein